MLTKSQEFAFEQFKEGHNLFICGSGGNGKSFLIDHINNYCHSKYIYCRVCSTTGTSAVNINGKTLHSLFGLKPWAINYEQHADFIIDKYKFISKQLRKIRVLIIDEVSMLDDVMCNGISLLLQRVNDTSEPFGGVQIIFVGDIFQLPPVQNNYCFFSESWTDANPKIIELKECVRQEGDIEFYNILEEVKYGSISQENYDKLKSLKNNEFPEDIKPTKLYSTNVDVDKINIQEFNKLKENNESKVFTPIFSGFDKKERERTIKKYEIELCLDSQVMITRNVSLDDNIVNGTRGVVTKMCDDFIVIKTVDNKKKTIPYIKDDIQSDSKTKKTISYLPVKLAYALTIHKSQGATLDCMEIDLGNKIFSNGQAYTGLSRARNMKSVKITKIKKESIRADEKVVEWMQKNK